MKHIQFIGNYYNPDASYGEERLGEAILKIDLDTGVLFIQVNERNEGKYKLSKIK